MVTGRGESTHGNPARPHARPSFALSANRSRVRNAEGRPFTRYAGQVLIIALKEDPDGTVAIRLQSAAGGHAGGQIDVQGHR